MNQLAGYGGEHRIVITREGAMDELVVRVEAAAPISPEGTGGQQLREDAVRAIGQAVAASRGSGWCVSPKRWR